MTKEEAIEIFEDMKKGIYRWDDSEYIDTAISALKGLDLPDNATNEDALNYMLRQTFPKVIFIRFKNEANLTEGMVMTREWLDSPYKGVSE